MPGHPRRTYRRNPIMRSVRLVTLMCALAVPSAGVLAADTSGTEVREWHFRVLLDGDEIGFHRFRLEEFGESRYICKVTRNSTCASYFSPPTATATRTARTGATVA